MDLRDFGVRGPTDDRRPTEPSNDGSGGCHALPVVDVVAHRWRSPGRLGAHHHGTTLRPPWRPGCSTWMAGEGDARLGWSWMAWCGRGVGCTNHHHVPGTTMEVLPTYHGVACTSLARHGRYTCCLREWVVGVTVAAGTLCSCQWTPSRRPHLRGMCSVFYNVVV